MKIRHAAILWLTFLFFAGSCQQGIKSQEPVQTKAESVKIADYGQALFALDPLKIKEGLDSLSGEFKFFIGDDPDALKEGEEE